MTHLFFKLTVSVLLICTSLTASMRYFPYDTCELDEIREFFKPSDGSSPEYFMGMIPGVTTIDEVIQILEVHPWVEELQIPKYQYWVAVGRDTELYSMDMERANTRFYPP